MARSGARVGPTSIHERAARSIVRSSFMRAVLPGPRLVPVDEGVAKPGGGVVQSGAGRARGDAEELGDLHERQPEVVVQDEDRPLLDREPAERPLQFVAVGDGGSAVRGGGPSTGRTRTFAVQWRARCDSS